MPTAPSITTNATSNHHGGNRAIRTTPPDPLTMSSSPREHQRPTPVNASALTQPTTRAFASPDGTVFVLASVLKSPTYRLWPSEVTGVANVAFLTAVRFEKH